MLTQKKRKHIAVIGTRGPCNFSGVETISKELYPYLTGTFDVTIYSRTPYVDKSVTEHAGARVVHLMSGNSKHFEAFFHSFLATVHAMFSSADVLHFHAQGPALFTILPRIFTPWKKVIFTCHSLDWQRAKWSRLASSIIKAGEWCSARFPHSTTAVSQSLKEYYQQEYGTETHFIPNGTTLDENTLDAPPRTTGILETHGLERGEYLLFVGRLVPEKAIHDLIAAYKQLPEETRKARKLVIAGGSSATNSYVESLHASVGQDPDIIFTGFVDGPRLAELYASAFWFISPSHLEGFNITAIEAMGRGVPVLLSDLDVHQEFAVGNQRSRHGAFIRFFKTADVDDLTAKLSELVEVKPEDREQMTPVARGFVKDQYQWKTIAKKYMTLIDTVAGTPIKKPDPAPSRQLAATKTPGFSDFRGSLPLQPSR